MLILTRCIGQKIKIGNDISITVLNIQGSQVRLGVEAPRHITVHREEIYHRIALERAKQPDADVSPTTGVSEEEEDEAIGNR